MENPTFKVLFLTNAPQCMAIHLGRITLIVVTLYLGL